MSRIDTVYCIWDKTKKKKVYRTPSSTEAEIVKLSGKKSKPSIRSSLPGADFVVRVYIEMGLARWVGEWLRHCRSARYTTLSSQKQFIFRAVEWEEGSERSLYAYLVRTILVVLISEAFVFGILRRRHSVRAAVDPRIPRIPRRSFSKTYIASQAHTGIYFALGIIHWITRDITRRELTRNRLSSERVNNSPAIDYN